MDKPIVLTIAGSDPSGGAGIQADIRAFEASGVYGLSVITAITVQTVDRVLSWKPVDATLVKEQLDTLLEEYPVKCVKCGMLPTKEIIDLVVEVKAKYNFLLICDPILISSSGVKLGQDEIETYYKEKLFPIIDILTPNSHEVKAFTGIELEKMTDVITAGQAFEEMGVKSVVFKGGHIDEHGGEVVDYCYHEGGVELFTRERVQHASAIHGTGCIFSALLTAQLSFGHDLYSAIFSVERSLEQDFRHLQSLPITKGGESKALIVDVGISPAEHDALEEVQEVYNYIRGQAIFSELVPEVRTNISVCIPKAKAPNQVAAIEGRISVVNGLPKAAGLIKMGAANHTARLVLTAHAKDPEIRACINIKYMPELIKPLAEEGFYLFQIRREDQPDAVKSYEQNSMQWIIGQAYSVINKIPDIIWDCGEPEKEPMIRMFAKDAKDLIDKIKGFIRVYKRVKENKQ